MKQEDHQAIKLDVSSGESVENAMKQIVEKYKSCPDAVVNSAGITMDGYLLKMTDDNFDKVIDVNLKGTYRINKIAASAMKSAKLDYGSIVNISSIVGKFKCIWSSWNGPQRIVITGKSNFMTFNNYIESFR